MTHYRSIIGPISWLSVSPCNIVVMDDGLPKNENVELQQFLDGELDGKRIICIADFPESAALITQALNEYCEPCACGHSKHHHYLETDNSRQACYEPGGNCTCEHFESVKQSNSNYSSRESSDG